MPDNEDTVVVDEVVVEGATPEQQEEARQFGWVPKDEFKGKEEDWRDADEFLEKGKTINGFLRKDLEKIQKQLQAKNAEFDEMRDTIKQFREYHEKTQERAYKEALAELKRQKKEAIEIQDGEAVVAIDDSIEQLREEFTASKTQQAPTAPTKANTPDPAYIEWAEENTWYATNPELRAVAELYGEQIKATNPHLFGKDFLTAVTNKVKERFPEEFSNPARGQASVSSTGESRTQSSRGKKKTFNDLPPEAKQACLKFEKQGLLTKEQYVAEYDWE